MNGGQRSSPVDEWYSSMPHLLVSSSFVAKCNSRLLSLTDRDEYSGSKEFEIKAQLAAEIHSRIPMNLQDYVVTELIGPVSLEDQNLTRRRQIYKFYKKMERWHRIASVVGWLGIFLSHSFPVSKVTETSDSEFDAFLGIFSIQRPRIVALMEQDWPDAPEILKIVGSKTSFPSYFLP